MTRRLILSALALALATFYVLLFIAIPWYFALGIVLGITTAWMAIVLAELHWGDLAIEVSEPSGEETADAPDLWCFPDRCHEAEDPYREAA